MKRFLLCILMCLFLSLFLLVQCAKQTVNSLWADETMKINGEISEWETAMSYDEKLDASYGFQNDGEYLYVAFETGNQMLQRQLLMSGLVIWLNDVGDKSKDIGFKFPRGLMERGKPSRDLMTMLRNQNSADDQRVQYFIDQNFRDLQVLDGKSQNLGIYTQREALDHNIQFKLNLTHGLMIYELCIPLEGSSRHPWTFLNLENVGIGFETPQFDRSSMGGRRPSGGNMMEASGGGGGGRGGGRGGGGMGDDMSGGGMPGGRGQAQQINIWITAIMATQ